MISEVLRHICRLDQFVVTSHARPDGDAVGSVLACTQMLRTMGKQAEAVLYDGVPHIYRGLPYAETVVTRPSPGKSKAVLLLECDSLQRTRLQGLDGKFVINIDHHTSARAFADVNWIDPGACATAEMVFRLAREAGVPLTREVATCLYTAVLTDTGSFCFEGTNERTFALAQELVRAGADPVDIAQRVYFSAPLSKMRMLGTALGHLERDGSLTWMHVSRKEMDILGASDEDCEGLVNYALGIEGVEVAVFFREMVDGRLRVSLRSKGAINVARIAEQFGGGGHECASGFGIEGPLPLARERVLLLLREHGYGTSA